MRTRFCWLLAGGMMVAGFHAAAVAAAPDWKAFADPATVVLTAAFAESIKSLGELKAAAAYRDIVSLAKDKEGLQGTADKRGLNCLRDCPAYLACYALGEFGDERAIPVLVDLLDDADLQTSARQALESLTKQKLGDNAAAWKAWWRSKQ